MAMVVFDVAAFREIYPQFGDGTQAAADQPGKLTDAQLTNAFDVACLLLDNTDASPAPYDSDKGILARKTLLYLLVCHLATMALWALSGQAGPVAAAAEGSVNISFALPPLTDRTYFTLTPCGTTYWQLMKKYALGGRYYAAGNHHPWG